MHGVGTIANIFQSLAINSRAASRIVLFIAMAFVLSSCAAIKAINMVRGGAAYGDQNEESTVPFSLHGHLLLVKVRLNDDERERIFFVDTGALTVINKTLADTMHFTSDVHITGKDTSGHNKETRLVEVESLRIGDMEVKGCAAAIFDFALIERAMGLQVDGIIGSNVLRFFTVTIDYKRKIITLSQNKQSRTGGKYRVPFKQDMTVGFAPIVEATIDDKYTVQVIIDTGYDGYFAAVPKSLLAKLKRPTRAVKGISTGGAFGVATEGELARLKSFELGKALRIPNVPVESTKMDKALLGKQFLDKFIVTINYLSNELTLDPIEENVRFKDNIFSTGLRVMYDEQNRAKVIGIEQGSPADKHGIRLEDEVVQINGKPVNSYSVPELIEKLVLNDEIKRLELVIKREGTEQSIVLEKTYVFEQPR